MIRDDSMKLYYSIGEVSELLELSKSLIRFWDSEFDILKPHKNSKGDRRFTKQNIDQLLVIKGLVKDKGFTLKGAKQYIKQNKTRISQKTKTLGMLKDVKRFLEGIRQEINS